MICIHILFYFSDGELIPSELVRRAVFNGYEVVVHGETLVEPVENGTNRAAVSYPAVDILAHPGLISAEEVEMAKENGIYLEISSRRGHCLANGHVASVSQHLNCLVGTFISRITNIYY